MLSDVPYGLGTKQPTPEEILAYLQGAELDTGGDFMQAKWSVPSVAVWREIFRVVKPGAPLLIFAGARTVDLISIGMRMAGFEIAENLLWLTAQGMPKPASTTDKYIDKHLKMKREVIGSRVLTGNATVPTKDKGGTYGIQVGTLPPKEIPVTAPASPEAKRWAGHGHALRPSYEPVIRAQKPRDGRIAENVLRYDVGGLNIGDCRLGSSGGTRKAAAGNGKPGSALQGSVDGSLNGGLIVSSGMGRWPPNIGFLHHESCEKIGTRKIKAAPTWNDNRPTPSAFTGGATSTVHHSDGDGSESIDVYRCVDGCPVLELEMQSETSSRCFPCFQFEPKVDARERDYGCDAIPHKSAAECTKREGAPAHVLDHPAVGAARGGGARNHGPCLKPIRLTTWIATLLLPPPRDEPMRTVLVPYCGTGSELIGALRAGWDRIIGIERDAEYIEIARHRLARWSETPVTADIATARAGNDRQGRLF